jgi:hypothetical protein
VKRSPRFLESRDRAEVNQAPTVYLVEVEDEGDLACWPAAIIRNSSRKS